MTTRPRSARPLATLVVAATLVGAGLAACSSDDDVAAPGGATTTAPVADGSVGGPGVVVPGAEWEVAGPEALGFDPDVLEELAEVAEVAGSTCLAVVRDGRLAAEWYWGDGAPDRPQEVFSVTKSVTSTLVGLAVGDGDLDLDGPAAAHLPAWAGTESEDVTVRNLVANDSGREWSANLDYVQLVGERDRNTFAVGLGQDAPPGETWVYNNAAIQSLSPVLEVATGTSPADYAAERLFEPIGMADSEMAVDGGGGTLTFMGLSSTCGDLARFGHLMLLDGRWGDEQVLPTGWVSEATGAPATDLNAAYGYLWWLNREGPIAGATQAVGGGGQEREVGQLVPGAPEDRYWALGLGNQLVQVDPGTGTVVVRLGPMLPVPDVPAFDAAAASRVVDEALVDDGAGG